MALNIRSRARALRSRVKARMTSMKRNTAGIVSRSTNTTLSVALVNQTSSNTVYAYVTGQDATTGAFVLIQADGKTPYYPVSPATTGSPLAVNCSIPLGTSGSTTTITIPRIAGGRIWFCVDDTLTFLVNPGPGLVEPSVSNPADTDYNKNWGFCEFTFNSAQLFANITAVDFFSLPISLSLLNTSGALQSVGGLPKNGLQQICDGLEAQQNVDHAGWDQLIVKGKDGSQLRALSPNTGIVLNSSLFNGYYDSYVSQVWARYASTPLSVDTQNARYGTLTATVVNDLLVFPGTGPFGRPSTADIFSCSTGPFGYNPTNTEVMGALTARLSAAFNRSTLLTVPNQPGGENVGLYYYNNPITNHYSRIVHQLEAGGRGYAFPYDDVVGDGGVDVSGSVSDGSPQTLTVTVGGT